MKRLLHYLSVLFIVLLVSCAGGKFSKRSTADLKLRHAQIIEALGMDANRIDVKIGHPFFMGSGDRKDRIEEKENIERELLRRYEAGDKGAHLPIFDR